MSKTNTKDKVVNILLKIKENKRAEYRVANVNEERINLQAISSSGERVRLHLNLVDDDIQTISKDIHEFQNKL